MSMTHTLDSNAISRNRASAIMIKNERRAEAEAALRTVEGRGFEFALWLVVGNILGVLLSMSRDVDCTPKSYSSSNDHGHGIIRRPRFLS